MVAGSLSDDEDGVSLPDHFSSNRNLLTPGRHFMGGHDEIGMRVDVHAVVHQSVGNDRRITPEGLLAHHPQGAVSLTISVDREEVVDDIDRHEFDDPIRILPPPRMIWLNADHVRDLLGANKFPGVAIDLHERCFASEFLGAANHIRPVLLSEARNFI